MICRFAGPLGLLLAAIVPGAVAAPQQPLPPPLQPLAVAVATPADIFGPLYRAVELGRLFPDSKTFADAEPREDVGAILADYRRTRPAGAALRGFVDRHFVLPATPAPPRAQPATVPLARQIEALWPVLARDPQPVAPGSSALALPTPYVVPGGRFRELYYWDSYFTMLGLARAGRLDLVEGMIDDFTALIERYGHIPNGTRSYYLSRSQPPLFYRMLELSRVRDAAVLHRRLAALRSEHAYWMRGADGLSRGQAAAHVVRLADGTLLNRYWDARQTPRDESYAEDSATAAGLSPAAATALWRELRAGAESGWDYSSRWRARAGSLRGVSVTTIAPVDLNSLMAGMERAIAAGCARERDAACARAYDAEAAARTTAIRRLMWDRRGYFTDLDWRSGRPTGTLTAAAAAPLFTGVATPAQAATTAATIRARLLAPGGLRTTLARTGQQWDAPNGWAPLQWIAIAGLRRYRLDALADTIAARWSATVAARYRATGLFAEKYDVETQAGAGGGEYPNQIGFGWTNGVAAALLPAPPPP